MSIDLSHIFLLLKIIGILRWKLGLVDLEEFNQNLIRCRNHNILPESQIANTFLKHNTSGPEFTNYLFYVVALNPKMMNTSLTRGLRGLIIEMKSSAADSHEYVSCTYKF